MLQQQQLQQQQQQGPGWGAADAATARAPPAAAPAGAPSDVDIADRAETLSTIKQLLLLYDEEEQQMPAWGNPLTPWAPGQSSASQAPSLAMQQAQLQQQMQLQQLHQQHQLLQQQQLQQQEQQGPGWVAADAATAKAPPAAAAARAPRKVGIGDRGQLNIIKRLLLQVQKEELLLRPTRDDTTEQEDEAADVDPKIPK